MVKKKKRHQREGLTFFMNYLPDDILNSLHDNDRYHYEEYRRYKKLIEESDKKVDKYKQQIDKLKQLIKKEVHKVKEESADYDWKRKMTNHYDKISHLDKELKLNCSIEKRDRTSKSKKIADKGLTPAFGTIVRKTYRGKPLVRYSKIYGRVEKDRYNQKTLYFGDESEVRKLLSELHNKDWSKDPFDYVKDELRVLMSQFSRYHIFHSNWDEFMSKTHNLRSIVDWCKLCDENGLDRYEWGGTK